MADVERVAAAMWESRGNSTKLADAENTALVAIYRNLARAALAAMGPVKVKPLVWGEKFAHTDLGIFYAIDLDHDGAVLAKMETSGATKSFHQTGEAAKAAAQADYERRILSAIAAPQEGEA